MCVCMCARVRVCACAYVCVCVVAVPRPGFIPFTEMQLMPPGLGGEGCGRGVDRTAEWTAAHSVSCRIHINVQWHQAPCRTDTALSVSCVASGHIGVSSTLLNTDMHDAD